MIEIHIIPPIILITFGSFSSPRNLITSTIGIKPVSIIIINQNSGWGRLRRSLVGQFLSLLRQNWIISIINPSQTCACLILSSFILFMAIMSIPQLYNSITINITIKSHLIFISCIRLKRSWKELAQIRRCKQLNITFIIIIIIIIDIIFTIMHKVDGVVVINNEGIPIKSTLDSTSTVQVNLMMMMVMVMVMMMMVMMSGH